MLQRIASGDSTVCDQDYDFRDSEVVNFTSWDALSVASAFGYSDIVNRLLEIQEVIGNAHIDNNAALQEAAANGHVAIVNRLLEIQEVIGLSLIHI